MGNNVTSLAGIVQTVPLLFHRLRAIGDALHAEDGITTPMRGVMQSIFVGGPQTVPQLAAARPVSRQHIQAQVDALASRGLVKAVPNPAHKRSSHIVLTNAGRRLFQAMKKKEMQTLAGFVGKFSAAELRTTEHTLAKIADQLAYHLEHSKETNDDD